MALNFAEEAGIANSVVLPTEESSVLICADVTMDSVALIDIAGGVAAAVVAFNDTACVLAISDEPGAASVELPTEPSFIEEFSTGDSVALPDEDSALLMLE